MAVNLFSCEEKPRWKSQEQFFLITSVCGKTLPTSTTLISSITVNIPEYVSGGSAFVLCLWGEMQQQNNLIYWYHLQNIVHSVTALSVTCNDFYSVFTSLTMLAREAANL